MSEETAELITSFANPNYSHVSSLLVGSGYKEANLDEDYEEENSLLLLKSDDDCDDDEEEHGNNALSALADAIHSLELMTKDQQNIQQQTRMVKDREYPAFSERLDRSSGCSNDSAFSSPTSECSPPTKPKRYAPTKEECAEDDLEVNEGSDSHADGSGGGDSDLKKKDSENEATFQGEDSFDKTNPDEVNEDSDAKVVVDLLADDDDEEEEGARGMDNQATESNILGESDKSLTSACLEVLSPGWERCEDASGPYYWHIKTGTIQRHPPNNVQPSTSMEFRNKLTEPDVVAETKPLLNVESSAGEKKPSQEASSSVPSSSSIAGTRADSATSQQDQQSSSAAVTGDNPELPVRFAVRSLGWVAVNEEDLTRERSSQTVNRCIVDLSTGGRRDINDSIGKWGDGKYLYMDVDQSNLSLIDPIDLTVLNTQAIKSLRVWGVGRENARDFAYVARDKITRAFACHVFRCDQPARHIAATLCHVCKMAVARRDVLLGGGSSSYSSSAAVSGANGSRPNRLPDLEGKGGAGEMLLAKYEDLLKNSSFPTPMDEPKKVINCHYLGTIQVSMPTGIEVLNGAIDTLNVRIPPEKWKYVDVTVAPSTITIAEHELPENIVSECRVRFLSFLGISVKQTKLCAFIMHTAQDNFIAHVFYCEPSAGPLCKTIEAACKLRFQKCLDRKGLSASGDQNLQNQSGNQTIKIGTAGQLVETSKTLQQEKQISIKFPETEKLFLQARAGIARSAVGLKGGLSRASSVVSESAGNFRQMVSSVSVKNNLNHSAQAVRGILTNGFTVTKTGLSSTMEFLKKKRHSLQLPLGFTSQSTECDQSLHKKEEIV